MNIIGNHWRIKDINIHKNSLGLIMHADEGYDESSLLNCFINTTISKNKIGNQCKYCFYLLKS